MQGTIFKREKRLCKQSSSSLPSCLNLERTVKATHTCFTDVIQPSIWRSKCLEKAPSSYLPIFCSPILGSTFKWCWLFQTAQLYSWTGLFPLCKIRPLLFHPLDFSKNENTHPPHSHSKPTPPPFHLKMHHLVDILHCDLLWISVAGV